MRRIEIHLPAGETYDTVLRAVRNSEPIDYSVIEPEQRDRRIINVLMRDRSSQKVVDAIHTALADTKDWRLTIFAIEASLPEVETDKDEPGERSTRAIREEILSDVSEGALLDRDFLLLVALSTIVAAVGLNADSAAGVIGAMVIAPLLGPILAFSMGAALGNMTLLRKSGRTLALGIALAFVASLLIGLFVPIDLTSGELMNRAEVRLDAIALALASGAAAALSIAKGKSAVLVGVMVAAALLPPGAAIGLFIGAGYPDLGARAALLLLLNVACLIVAALVTFRLRGIGPRGWLEQKQATRAVRINIALTLLFLVLTAVLIVYFDLGAKVQLPG